MNRLKADLACELFFKLHLQLIYGDDEIEKRILQLIHFRRYPEAAFAICLSPQRVFEHKYPEKLQELSSKLLHDNNLGALKALLWPYIDLQK